jgi:DNA replication protein DnaC
MLSESRPPRRWPKTTLHYADLGIDAKSHLAQAIGLEALKAGFVVLYRSIFDLVRELLSQETLSAEARLLNKYLKPDLLIIDKC